MRLVRALRLLLAMCVLLLGLVDPAQAARPRLTLAAPSSAALGSPVAVRVSAKHRRRGDKVIVQARAGRRWRDLASRPLKSARVRVVLTTKPRAGTFVLRARLRRGGRFVATSSVRRVRIVSKTLVPSPVGGPRPVVSPPGDAAEPAPSLTPAPTPTSTPTPAATPTATPEPDPEGADDGSTYRIPASTRLYRPSDIVAAAAGATSADAQITVADPSKAPGAGGHVAIAPTADFPDGMFATVVSTHRDPLGRTQAELRQASVDQVLSDVRIDFDRPVTPEIVDVDGQPSRVQAIHGDAAGATMADNPFSCTTSGGLPLSVPDALGDAETMPIDIAFEESSVQHIFDAGSLYPAREPRLVLWFAVVAKVTLGFQAKSGINCELTPTWRRHHRLRFRAGAIGGVPVSLNLEPAFSFGVSAAAGVKVSQRYHMTLKIEREGYTGLPRLSLPHSADPAEFDATASITGSAFLGGDLSVMLGGGYKSANAQAGVYGTLGPRVSVTTDSNDPGCLAAELRIESELGVRFELWSERWDFKAATLTTPPWKLGEPRCPGYGPPDPLGTVRDITPPPWPGATWTRGLNDGSDIKAAPHDRVLVSTCESTASLASDPILQLVDTSGHAAWQVPVGLDHTTWGCPPATTARDDVTFFEVLEPSGFVFKAVDANGTVLWSRPAPGSTLGIAPAVGSNGTVYFATRTDYGSSRVDGYEAKTGRRVLTNLRFSYLTTMAAYDDGLVFVDLSAGNYAPVVKYVSYAGATLHEYPATDAVSANYGVSSYAIGAHGTVFVAGAPIGITCGTTSAITFGIQKITPTGPGWLWTDPTKRPCTGGSRLAAEPSGGVYITTGDTAGENTLLRRIDGSGALAATRQLTGSLHAGISVDLNGVAVVATDLRYRCSPTAPPDSCDGSLLSFVAPSGALAFPSVDAKDPESGSYFSGIISFAIAQGSVVASHSSGDWHSEIARFFRFAVPGLASDYGVTLAP